jgi:hypothetical protein
MTWDEFRKDWYTEHCACFTGIPAWMAKLEKTSEGPAARDVVKRWYGVLRDIDLSAAKKASHMMHAGEIEEPRGYDRHPAAIRNAAKSISPNGSSYRPRSTADGQPTFSCLRCEDIGLVFCWHPAFVAKIAKKGFEPNAHYDDCAMPCTCAAGDVAAKNFPTATRYDPKRAMLLGIGGTKSETEREKLLEWLANREPLVPENYESAFDSPSQAQTAMEF